MGEIKKSSAAFAVGFIAAIPFATTFGAAYAGGATDASGPFGGDVDSGGGVQKFTVVRCDTDAYSVGISVDSFTSPSGRVMQFRPVQTSSYDYQAGTSWVSIAQGASGEMGLSQHCWRFGAQVDPGRDTNGLSPGSGVTSFDGQLKY